MGEIADLMINGDICTQCGVPLSGDGYAVLCRSCRRAEKAAAKRSLAFQCMTCGKRLATQAALEQHTAAVHAKQKETP